MDSFNFNQKLQAQPSDGRIYHETVEPDETAPEKNVWEVWGEPVEGTREGVVFTEEEAKWIVENLSTAVKETPTTYTDANGDVFDIETGEEIQIVNPEL